MCSDKCQCLWIHTYILLMLDVINEHVGEFVVTMNLFFHSSRESGSRLSESKEGKSKDVLAL